MRSQQSPVSGRRKFLRKVGGLAAVAASAPFAFDIPAGASGDEHEGGHGHDHDTDDALERRAREAYRLRVDAARFQRDQPQPSQRSNGDEQRYSNFIGNFSKTLPHDAFGTVDPAAYQALLRAMRTADPDDFAAIPMGGVGKLSDPQAAFAFQLDGADSHHLGVRVPPALASAEEAGEMAEVYWLALTRDVPFANYGTDPDIAAAAASLSTFSDFRGPKTAGQVTPATIFRGTTPGELTGPYISQFLLRNISFGPYSVLQKVRAGLAGIDYMWDYASWLNVQNGVASGPFGVIDAASARFINDNRALSAYLRADFSPQAFINAGLMLSAFGPSALSPSNPYRTSLNQAGMATFGGGELIDLIAHASGMALKACWYQKWAVHRRLRPEAFGGLIHNAKTTGGRSPIHHEILDSSVLTAVHNRYGTYLLPMAYPEGSPAHPSYPAGHAVFAGAGATILKAFFDETFVIPAPVVASSDGTLLNPYAGTLTVGNELNKLAANISLGRDATGVHWRTDGLEGMHLGEASAIALLEDVKRTYNERFGGFTFTKFDGTTIVI
jgi:membrane-associated phospholipid phosphatase